MQRLISMRMKLVLNWIEFRQQPNISHKWILIVICFWKGFINYYYV